MRPTRTRDKTMTREEAIMNAALVMNYLATYERQAYLTLDITQHDVRIHYFDMYSTEEEVKRVAKKLEAIRMSGTELEFAPNHNIGQLTFNVYWNLWK